MVRSEHVRTLFDSTPSQESESDGFYVAMRIKTHLDSTLSISASEHELVIAVAPAGID